MDSAPPDAPPSSQKWINRSIVGIILATFFSDVSHEIATAVLPLFLATVGLGPAALGMIEGASDLLFSLSKLGGGVLGHHVERKRPWASLGYLVTSLATASMGIVHSLAALVSLRSIAWIGRGFRSPLRDFLLADNVEPTHFGRAYGLERAGDMLGAVVGPLIAVVLVWMAIGFRTIILWTLLSATGSPWDYRGGHTHYETNIYINQAAPQRIEERATVRQEVQVKRRPVDERCERLAKEHEERVEVWRKFPLSH